MRMPSSGERSFMTLWRSLGGPEPVREFRFDAKRRWRFDFAWPESMVAVEIDGGVYSRGRHVRGRGFEGDLEKVNAAVLQGWRVLRFTPGMVERNPFVLLDVMRMMGVMKEVENE